MSPRSCRPPLASVPDQPQSLEEVVATSARNLYLFQFSHQFGDDIYLPYSVGMLWAYARQFPEIAEGYRLGGFVFVREDPDTIAARVDAPAVAAFSTYVWNWEMSLRVARALKRRHPDCLIVFGGPQVPDPDRADGFFSRFPFIDVAVHGEGEVTFTELLAAHARGDDLVAVPGLSCRSGTAPARGRTTDLDAFPSPYLTGVFEPLFALPFSYHAVWETNRGCPYRCAFCDWGSLTNQKLYTFRDDRLSAEIEYFAARKIGYVYMADANFGILPRDLDIARRLANTKARTGLPHKLRVNYAKNSPDRVHEIARTLNAVQLDKGITLSVQSMDAHTLQTITRTNLKYESLSRFIRQYQREGIDTITEVILGLPGETLRSFRDGIDELLEASAHDTLWIYRCTVLPNAQMNDPPYRARHGIVTKRTPVFLNHTVPGSDPVQEYEDIVTETATLSREDYKRCLILSWAVQTFHALNI
jgi:radical SAM superfamily enzyme YgiQ (UPF0313 family)